MARAATDQIGPLVQTPSMSAFHPIAAQQQTWLKFAEGPIADRGLHEHGQSTEANEEVIMTNAPSTSENFSKRVPWNKGKVAATEAHLNDPDKAAGRRPRTRDLTLFNIAIDSKLQ